LSRRNRHFSGTTISNHSSAFQLGEMTGDAGLAHVKDLLQLGDRKFFFLEQEEETQSSWISQHPEQING
jgi:hypothetical protein